MSVYLENLSYEPEPIHLQNYQAGREKKSSLPVSFELDSLEKYPLARPGASSQGLVLPPHSVMCCCSVRPILARKRMFHPQR